MSGEHGPILIAGHELAFDGDGCLQPWTSWVDALSREMEFYRQCPSDQGYPRFVHATFLDGEWNPITGRTDSIPSTQNGMGIISYLKYHALCGKSDPRFLDTARLMGDYLVNESLTPDSGRYPRITRSTGRCATFPLPADAGSQGDRPYEIEPDKAGIAGHALLCLLAETGDGRYLAQALHNARVLAANQQAGDATHSPWPFRADFRSGEARGEVSGNMVFVLRLYDGLLALGHREFFAARESLWTWIRDAQIPSAAAGGALFAQFFEDHETATNRTAWAPLNLARYLLERKDSLSVGWRLEAATLIDFVRSTFTHEEYGITVCHEQDEDKEAWGGINSTYGAVLALYAKAISSSSLAHEAREALTFTLYSIDARGRPRDLHTSGAVGGWQEDAHTDVIHNFVDALAAFPEWSTAPT